MARARKSYGQFERRGAYRTAYSAAEAVQLEYDGWARMEEQTESSESAAAPAKAATKKTASK